MVSNSGPLMEMKFAWHSLAMALANNVLPEIGMVGVKLKK